MGRGSQPAFPGRFVKHAPGEVGNSSAVFDDSSGMELRDYFAAKAMQGWLSTYGERSQHPSAEPPRELSSPTAQEKLRTVARQAYAIADAMMEEREKR